jgi:hypothetical protein
MYECIVREHVKKVGEQVLSGFGGIAQLKSILAPFFAVFLTLMVWNHHQQPRRSFIKPSAVPQTSAVPFVMSSVFLMS